mmetsp:Transcript_22465/g.36356  ORF Transcript_22465/g.36356 Transcript_22465/m.36356 type:complete len:356 (+) Transcript_22465:622-1689(+)
MDIDGLRCAGPRKGHRIVRFDGDGVVDVPRRFDALIQIETVGRSAGICPAEIKRIFDGVFVTTTAIRKRAGEVHSGRNHRAIGVAGAGGLRVKLEVLRGRIETRGKDIGKQNARTDHQRAGIAISRRDRFGHNGQAAGCGARGHNQDLHNRVARPGHHNVQPEACRRQRGRRDARLEIQCGHFVIDAIGGKPTFELIFDCARGHSGNCHIGHGERAIGKVEDHGVLVWIDLPHHRSQRDLGADCGFVADINGCIRAPGHPAVIGRTAATARLKRTCHRQSAGFRASRNDRLSDRHRVGLIRKRKAWRSERERKLGDDAIVTMRIAELGTAEDIRDDHLVGARGLCAELRLEKAVQ